MADEQHFNSVPDIDGSQSWVPGAIPPEHAVAMAENPLAHLNDEQLQGDVDLFLETSALPVNREELLRAARVAKNIQLYDEVALNRGFHPRGSLKVDLTDDEKRALRQEKNVPFSERGMRVVIVTVSLAAILQGFVQSSFNGANLYKEQWGLNSTNDEDWGLGAANASPWFFGAIVGCPSAIPINYWYGRRGGISIAAVLIFCSSVGAIFATSWKELLAIRAVNGIGMGIKAVSATILASECAVGFWRGSAILAWQLWVAFGIMMGFAFNFLFTTAKNPRNIFGLIQGAPLVPALVLFVTATFMCPESPRYHLMKGPGYSMSKAYKVLQRLRNTELQALRDLYLVTKALEREGVGVNYLDKKATGSPGFHWAMWDFCRQFTHLFTRRRLQNAVISTSTVNLAQQLCGINVPAFYSGVLFQSFHSTETGETVSSPVAMGLSLSFGAINFLFGLPAIKSIDTIGRRRWLLATLPLMAVFMLGASLAFMIQDPATKTGVTATFLILFAMVYSPALGPIPFTLAAESFPLSHREAGTAWAISVNLFFAGVLSMFFPRVYYKLNGRALGIFSGLNLAAFILVFFLVEETKQHSLEELDLIFEVPKSKFIRFQLLEYLPWWLSRYVLGERYPKPKYEDLFGNPIDPSPWTGRRPRNIHREDPEIDDRPRRTQVSGAVELASIPNEYAHEMRLGTN